MFRVATLGHVSAPMIAVMLLIISFGGAGAQERTAKLAHGYPRGSALDSTLRSFASNVQERLSGKLTIQVFPASQLVRPTETAEAVRSGAVDLAVIPIESLLDQLPALKIFDLVFLFPNLAAVDRFQTGPKGRELLRDLDGTGLKALGYLHRGMLQFAANEPILRPEDLQGRKIRAVGPPIIEEQLASLGANPVRMDFGEVFTALQTGVVDTATTTTQNIQVMGWQEVASALTAANYAYVGDVLAVASSFWANLEPETQSIIEAIAADEIQRFNAGVIESEQVAQRSLHFTALEDRMVWLEGLEPVWEPYFEEVGPRLLFAALEVGGTLPSWMHPEELVSAEPPEDVPATPRQEEDLFWNAWLEDSGEPVSQDEIEPGSFYTFVLDLSRFNLAALSDELASATSVGPRLAAAIASAKDHKLDLRIRAVLLGATAEHNVERTQRMRIQLNKLTSPLGPRVTALGDDIDLRDLASIGRIGVVGELSDNQPYRLSLQTLEAGCGAVALSIWDGEGRRPLDHMIYRFRIGSDEGAGAACSADPTTRSFESGLATLLQTTVLAEPAPDARPISAALHVFEVEDMGPPGTVGLALFAIAPSVLDAEPEILAWRLADPLSRSLSGGAFLAALAKAQSDAVDAGSHPDAYAALAWQLKNYLFTPQAGDQDAADAAFNALKALIVGASEPPLILARLIDSNGQLLYLPLRLLGAGGGQGPLGKRFDVVQPLPRERYVSARTCIMPWAFGLPEPLLPMTKLELSPKHETSVPWPHTIIRNFQDLENYIAPAGPEPPPAEGLLLVTHQANGEMWFDEEHREQAITSGRLRRAYSDGSVAVLAACEAAGLDDKNRLVVEQLNLKGMDAIIAAPYQVDLHYGVMMGDELATAIDDYRSNPQGSPPSIAELFDAVAVSVATQLAAVVGKDRNAAGRAWPPQELRDMAYEFQILGDHGVRLCAPDEGGER